MIRVRIAGVERPLEECDGAFFAQIDRLREGGLPVCVQVSVATGVLNMALSTGGCPPSGNRTRLPNEAESRVFAQWARLGLELPDFSVARLLEFLKQVSD